MLFDLALILLRTISRFFSILFFLSEELSPQFKLLNMPVDFPPSLLKKACSMLLNRDNFFDLISLKP